MVQNKKWRLIGALLAAAVSAILYSNTLSNGFVWDDEYLIKGNPAIESMGNIPHFFSPRYWNEESAIGATRQYRPVRTTSFALDYALWKRDPAGYHAANLILNAANSVLAFFFILGLLTSFRDKENREKPLLPPEITALAGALLFAAHPVHTEAVDYVKNRGVLLAGFFYLASLLAFLRFAGAERKSGKSAWFAASFVFALASLMSKEIGLTLPGVLALLILLALPRRRWKGLFLALAPFAALAVGFMIFRQMLLREDTFLTVFTKPPELAQRLAVARTYCEYLRLALFPPGLVVDRPFQPPLSIASWSFLVSALSLAASAALGVFLYKKNRAAFFGWCFFFLTLVPFSNLIYIPTRPIAEQRLYLPVLGTSMALALLFLEILPGCFKQPRKAIATGGAVLAVAFLIFSSATYLRNPVWKDSYTLWSDAVAKAPQNPRVNYHMGTALAQIGNDEKALPFYEKAIDLAPNYAEAHNNLGASLSRLGRLDQARGHLLKAVMLAPGNPAAQNNLGILFLWRGNFEDAARCARKALESRPGYRDARLNLAQALAAMDRLDEAREEGERVLEANHRDPEALVLLGDVAGKMGEEERAIGYYERALREQPGNAPVLNNLANLLDRRGRTKEAENRLRQAIRTQPGYARAYYSLANLYSRQNENQKAAAVYRKVLELEPKSAMARFNLGNALAREKQYKAAAGEFQKALDLDPGLDKARKNLSAILRYLETGQK